MDAQPADVVAVDHEHRRRRVRQPLGAWGRGGHLHLVELLEAQRQQPVESVIAQAGVGVHRGSRQRGGGEPRHALSKCHVDLEVEPLYRDKYPFGVVGA